MKGTGSVQFSNLRFNTPLPASQGIIGLQYDSLITTETKVDAGDSV